MRQPSDARSVGERAPVFGGWRPAPRIPAKGKEKGKEKGKDGDWKGGGKKGGGKDGHSKSWKGAEPSSGSSSRLNNEIADLRGAGEILELHTKRGAEFDFVNLVTALHRIAKAQDGQSLIGDRRLTTTTEEVRSAMQDDGVYKRPRHIAITACQ